MTCCFSKIWVNKKNCTIQLYPTYLSGLLHPTMVRRVISYGKDHFYQDTHEMTDYNLMCLHSLDRLLIAYVRGISAIITSVCFAYIGALYINCIHGQRDTIFGFKFFWLEDGSDTEYYINLAFQIFFAMYFILGNIVVETGASLHENNISLSTEIIKMDITRLSEDVEYGNITEFAMKSHLRRIVWKFQAVNKLLKEYDESFYWRYFLSPVAFTYSIGLSVFAQYMVSLHCVAGIHRSH